MTPEKFIARQRLSKQAPVEIYLHITIEEFVSKQWNDKHTTIGVLLETVFYLVHANGLYRVS
jgi:hypothetical protein